MNHFSSHPVVGSRLYLSILVAVTSSFFISGCATQETPQASAVQPIIAVPAANAANDDSKLVLNFTNVPDIPGNLMIAIYNKPESFRKDSHKSLKVVSTPGEMQVEIPGLSPGEYAVMVFHDQNGDGKLNRNLLGIPKEHWSGSLNTSFVLGPPSWNQTRFILQETGASIQVSF